MRSMIVQESSRPSVNKYRERQGFVKIINWGKYKKTEA